MPTVFVSAPVFSGPPCGVHELQGYTPTPWPQRFFMNAAGGAVAFHAPMATFAEKSMCVESEHTVQLGNSLLSTNPRLGSEAF